MSSLNPQSVALGDLNGDGKLDVVVGNEGSDGHWSVTVFLGKGDGTLLAPDEVFVEPTSWVALADFDGDGRLDVVVAETENEAAVLLGKGDGTFAAPAYYSAWDGVSRVATGDVNRDGKQDIVIATGDSTTVLLGKGDGTFAARLGYPIGANTLALGDLNGDGTPDLVTAAAYASSVTVALGACR